MPSKPTRRSRPSSARVKAQAIRRVQNARSVVSFGPGDLTKNYGRAVIVYTYPNGQTNAVGYNVRTKYHHRESGLKGRTYTYDRGGPLRPEEIEALKKKGIPHK